ncbi:MAG: hypothetical protein EOP48_12225 [Sphingobacteriales bacterium]|nr:MAG: hypothetical protein EOP48_12225 [Sphingobacteriales bacterium]
MKHYKVTEPDAPVNHIHFEDVQCIVKQLLATGSKGRVYNLVAPLHPTKAAVISSQWSTAEAVPAANDSRIVSSQKLIGEMNYTFQHPDPAKF